MIRLGSPEIDDSDIAACERVLRTGMLTQGAEVAAFEGELAALVGVRQAVVVSNGTAALVAALAALHVGRGDTVLMPGYSWVATANAAAILGAIPHFVDIDPRSHSMSPHALEDAFAALHERHIRPVAVITVHPFGHIADLDRIAQICAAYDVPLLEDAACALGGSFGTATAGSVGVAGCFSFHPRKIITTGEGGAVVTDDQRLADFIRSYRNHGQGVIDGRREFVLVGDNRRLTDFQAAMGRSQLARLGSILTGRRNAFLRYRSQLSDSGFTFQDFDPVGSTAQSIVALVPAHVEPVDLIQWMGARGVEVGGGTIDMPNAIPFVGDGAGCPVTTEVAARSMSLPVHSQLDEETIDSVVSLLRAGVREA